MFDVSNVTAIAIEVADASYYDKSPVEIAANLCTSSGLDAKGYSICNWPSTPKFAEVVWNYKPLAEAFTSLAEQAHGTVQVDDEQHIIFVPTEATDKLPFIHELEGLICRIVQDEMQKSLKFALTQSRMGYFSALHRPF